MITVIVGLFFRFGFHSAARRQFLEELRVRSGVMIYRKDRKRIVIVGRHEHKMLVVRTGAQRLSWLFEVSKLRIANLQNAGQSEALFIDVFGLGRRARLA